MNRNGSCRLQKKQARGRGCSEGVGIAREEVGEDEGARVSASASDSSVSSRKLRLGFPELAHLAAAKAAYEPEPRQH